MSGNVSTVMSDVRTSVKTGSAVDMALKMKNENV